MSVLSRVLSCPEVDVDHEHAHAAGQLMDAVTRSSRVGLRGSANLEAAERPDLMLEIFLLDETKPYHSLLPARILDISRARMADYWSRHPSR